MSGNYVGKLMGCDILRSEYIPIAPRHPSGKKDGNRLGKQNNNPQ